MYIETDRDRDRDRETGKEGIKKEGKGREGQKVREGKREKLA